MDKHEEAAASAAPPPYVPGDGVQPSYSGATAPYPVAPPQQYPQMPQQPGMAPAQPQLPQYTAQPAYVTPQPGVPTTIHPTTVPPAQFNQQQPQYVQGAGPPLPPGGTWQQTPQGPVYVTQTTTTVTSNNNVDSKTFQSLRTAIPELPMGLAITLCVINCLLPGVGTVIAGFAVFCCGNPGQNEGERFGTFCINFWIGIAQMFLVLFIVGWIWSIMWGVAFIAISDEGNKKRNGRGQTTTTTYVTTAPASYPAGPAPMHPAPMK